MNLKSCTANSKSKNAYVPHKLHSRPLRFITLPIFILSLFILFWFILCPLLYVSFLKTSEGWLKEWPYIYWSVALLVFVILMALLVLLWRCAPHTNKETPHNLEANLLLETKQCKQNDLDGFTLNTIQRSQSKPKNAERKQSVANSTLRFEDKLPPQNSVVKREPSSVRHNAQKLKARPATLAIPFAKETAAEVHSASSPLSPRELFFWDLIQSANASRKSTTGSFIEYERKYCSADNTPIHSPVHTKPNNDSDQQKMSRNEKSSETRYFIASVPDRKSLTSEVFLYVDGNTKGKQLRIRYNENYSDDEVFKD